jgi:hypothetical protein
MKTTILVEKATRELLKQLGSKGQTYDELINFLIIKKSTSTNEGNHNE